MSDYWEERHEEQEERRLFAALKKIFDVLADIRALLTPRPSRLTVSITGGSMPLQVGSSSTATLSVLDQNGNIISGFDFAANPPDWSVQDPALVALAAGPNPNDEVFTGVSEGTVNGSVGCAGLSLPFNFQVVAAAVVPTSLRLDFNPPVA